jgi:methyltransferase (TIGR00027 family)
MVEKRRAKPHYSRTGELMAVQRALESCHPSASRLFSDPLASDFVSLHWRLVLAAARFGVVRRAVEALYDFVGGPGPRASAVARTRLIDDVLMEATAGRSQVVILGAGFDCRAYRLPVLADCVVFEVDRLETQSLKRERLDRMSVSAVSPVTFVAVDFERGDLALALRDAGYDDQRPTIFLWEGVTQYLTAEAVDATLAAIRQLASSSASMLLFTYVDRAALDAGALAFPEAARWLNGVRARGEPWIFGLDPNGLGDYLECRGFTLESDVTTAQAGERYFAARGRSERGSRLYRVATATVPATQ